MAPVTECYHENRDDEKLYDYVDRDQYGIDTLDFLGISRKIITGQTQADVAANFEVMRGEVPVIGPEQDAANLVHYTDTLWLAILSIIPSTVIQ